MDGVIFSHGLLDAIVFEKRIFGWFHVWKRAHCMVLCLRRFKLDGFMFEKRPIGWVYF